MPQQSRKRWSERVLPARRGRPLADGFGESMRDIDRGIAVRLYRKREPIGFRERDRCRIERGDLLLVIEPVEG